MSSLGIYELYQFINANKILQQLIEEHKFIIQQAYDDIHPTRIIYNYEEGRVYKQGIDVEEYAIWLVETKKKFAEEEKIYKDKIDIFNKAFSKLSEDEKKIFHEYLSGEERIKGAKILLKLKDLIEIELKNKNQLIVTNQNSINSL